MRHTHVLIDLDNQFIMIVHSNSEVIDWVEMMDKAIEDE